MSARMAMFYEAAQPISAERHRDWCIDAGSNFAFARHTNSVPVMSVEFARAAREYAIVFAVGEEAPFPLAVLGLEDRQNLFITDEGGWHAQYIPAFVRRYPFVFATGDEGQTFTLCLDESFSGCNSEARGERLFAQDGSRTEYLDGVVGFLTEYQRQHQRTGEFAARLSSLDLLEPVQANVALNTGRRISLTGIHVVSRDKLKALPGDVLAALMADDHLELIYQHLASLANLAGMVDRLAKDAEAG